MATYNGEIFVKKQIHSILTQLTNNDELIIIDDKSNDHTIEIINEFNDKRIKLIVNDINIGVVKSFEKALMLTQGDIIFLSDQDDYWLSNRIDIMHNELIKTNSVLLISNMLETNVQSEFSIIKAFIMPRSNYFLNIFNIFFSKSLYFGSLMCFNKNILSYILPFPDFVKAHDIYISLMANSIGKICHLNDILLLRTNTGVNLTYKKRSILEKFYFKITIIQSIFFAFKFLKFENK
jgi:glycosyltransferase involved in cell wall biosynthesis